VRRAAVASLRITLAVAAIAALLAAAGGGAAQTERQPSLFKAMPHKRDEPVKITSATLEVRDKAKKATFSGNVRVVQGDTDIRCNVLDVFYEDSAAGADKGGAAPKAAAPGGRGNQQIRRMEARGSVVVTQKDQRAVGERAEFDMRSNTVTLIGNVVMTRGEDVLRGDRLVVDLTTGVYKVISTPGRPVEMMIQSKSGQQPKLGKPN
jgi:lipopolysaccharide export system protein LptA